MISAQDVAKYFLSLVREDEGDFMTNLKLQKLLYYAQGFHLAIFDTPLFPETIEAWTHGPVVPDVYHTYKGRGRGIISYKGELDLDQFDPQIIEFLDDVYRVYGPYTATALRNMTHVEPPWANTESGKTISHASMKAFFETRVVDDEEA